MSTALKDIFSAEMLGFFLVNILMIGVPLWYFVHPFIAIGWLVISLLIGCYNWMFGSGSLMGWDTYFGKWHLDYFC